MGGFLSNAEGLASKTASRDLMTENWFCQRHTGVLVGTPSGEAALGADGSHAHGKKMPKDRPAMRGILAGLVRGRQKSKAAGKSARSTRANLHEQIHTG